jgi:hypothetical protein
MSDKVMEEQGHMTDLIQTYGHIKGSMQNYCNAYTNVQYVEYR